MKKESLFILFLLIACKPDPKETSKNTLTKSNIPAFKESILMVKVSDLALKTTDDTISYALGIAWANGIGKIGLSKMSYAFYLGAHDYMVQNKTFTTTQVAGERLDREIEFLKSDSVYVVREKCELKDITLASKYDTLSYQLGFAWTRGAKEYGITKLTPVLLKGLMHGLKNDPLALFNYPRADQYLRAHVETLKAQQFAAIKIKNEQWLVANKLVNDIQVLPDGLQYKIIRKGKGPSPKTDEVVVCHYTATLIDHTKFESTYDEGAPLKAVPAGVIPGMREALAKMNVGSVWQLYVPYYLGYGSGGIKGKVPPFATLIYEIELLAVEDHL